MGELTINEKLELLAVKRAEWKAIETQNSDLLSLISDLEKEVKTIVSTTGVEAEGGGLKVSFVAGKTSYDGAMLHDVCKKVFNELTKASVILTESPSPVSPFITSSMAFLTYAIDDGEKHGEKTLRIAATKGKKE